MKKKIIVKESQLKRYLTEITKMNYKPLNDYSSFLLNYNDELVLHETPNDNFNLKRLIESLITEERGVPDFMDKMVSYVLAYIRKQPLKFKYNGNDILKSCELDIVDLPECNKFFLHKPKFYIKIYNATDSVEYDEFITSKAANQAFYPQEPKLTADKKQLLDGIFQLNLIMLNGKPQSKNYEFISHELLHSYEQYRRALNGSSLNSGNKENKRKTYIDLFSSYNPLVKKIGRALYLSDSSEINAYITQAFFQFKEEKVDEVENRDNYKNTSVYKEMEFINTIISDLKNNKFDNNTLEDVKNELVGYNNSFKQTNTVEQTKELLIKLLSETKRKYEIKFFKALSLYFDKLKVRRNEKQKNI